MIASPWITVIGVVADTHTVSLRAGTGPEFYLTSIQEPQNSMSLLVRAAVPPLSVTSDVRGVVKSIEAALPIALGAARRDIHRLILRDALP